MNIDDCYFLGKILKTHGVKGDLVAYLDTDSPNRYKSLKQVFIKRSVVLEEFEVTRISVNQGENTAQFHLAGIEDMSAAEYFLKAELYLPLSSLPPLRGKKFYYHEIKGFVICDSDGVAVGPIIDVIELPQYPVAECAFGEKTALIPLVEELIIRIDRREKKIIVHIPEGLLDIYRE